MTQGRDIIEIQQVWSGFSCITLCKDSLVSCFMVCSQLHQGWCCSEKNPIELRVHGAVKNQCRVHWSLICLVSEGVGGLYPWAECIFYIQNKCIIRTCTRASSRSRRATAWVAILYGVSRKAVIPAMCSPCSTLSVLPCSPRAPREDGVPRGEADVRAHRLAAARGAQRHHPG